jgi:hypothetical protein
MKQGGSITHNSFDIKVIFCLQKRKNELNLLHICPSNDKNSKYYLIFLALYLINIKVGVCLAHLVS